MDPQDGVIMRLYCTVSVYFTTHEFLYLSNETDCDEDCFPVRIICFSLANINNHIEPLHDKINNLVFDQVRLKPSCTATDAE